MNWTDGQTALLALLTLLTILGFLGDGYTTAIALQHGFMEVNPIPKFLFKKIGQSLTVFLSIVLLLGLGGTIAAHNLGAGYLFFGAVSALEGVRVVINYLKLKKANISLK